MASVRNAKANELNAGAELLKAQAAAETVLANAEAALTQAKAELEKANAALVNAKAETEKVQAELLKVQVQLQQVKVEEEKVELLKKQAELEAILAQLEVTKAQAEKDLANIAKQLQNIEAQMEVDAINNAIALLEAQAGMDEYARTLADEEREYLQEIAEKYFALQTEILNAEVKIFKNEIRISELEAGILDPAEVLADDIAEAEAAIARIDYLIAKAEEYKTYTDEEYEDALVIVRAELIDAYNEYYEAYVAFVAAQEEEAAAEDAIEATYYYEFNSYAEAYYLAREYAYVYTKYFPLENGYNYRRVVGYDDENGDFVELYTYTYNDGEYIFDYPEIEAEYEEKGISYPGLYFWTDHYVPGQINVENFKALLNSQVEESEKYTQDLKDDADEIAEGLQEEYQKQLDRFDAQVAEIVAYVEEVAPDFAKADAAEKSAQDAKDIAQADYDAAAQAVAIHIADPAFEAAKYAYDQAKANTADKQGKFDTAHQKTIAAKADSVGFVTGFITKYVTEEGDTKDFATAQFNLDVKIAQLTKAYKDAQVGEAALITAYNTAVTATATAKGKQTVAQATYDAKLSVWRAAYVALQADPTNTSLITAEATAKAALTTAQGELEAANADVTAKEIAEATAKTALDAKQAEIKTAEAELKLYTDDKAMWEKKIADGNAAIAKAQKDEAAAKTALDTAKADEKTAKTALDAAAEADGAEEKAALKAAGKNLEDANTALTKASNAVATLETIHPEYRARVIYLEEDAEDDRKDLEEQLKNLSYPYDGDNMQSYAEYIADIKAAFEDFKNSVEEDIEEIELYENQYRPAYVEAIEAYNEAEIALAEAFFADMYAYSYVKDLEEYRDGLMKCSFVNENGYIVEVAEYIADLEDEKQAIIDNINEQAQAIVDDNIDASIQIARLELKNEQLEAQIEIWMVILNQYAEILNGFFPNVEE